MTLKPKAFDAFVEFLRQPERVLSKQELLDAVWPGLVVTESSLFKVVQEIRRGLSEAGCVSAQIESVPGRGYRLVLVDGAVLSTLAGASASATDSASEPSPAASARHPRRWLAAAAGALLVALLLALLLRDGSPPTQTPTGPSTELSAESLEGLLRSAPAEALALLEALPPERRGSLQYRQLGQALLALGRTESAIAALERSLQIAEVDSERQPALRQLATALAQAGRQVEAVQRLREEEARSGALPPTLLLALGNAHLDLGALDAAQAAYARAADLARAQADVSMAQHILGNLGTLEYQRGTLEQARRHFEEALSLSLQALDTPVASALQANLGNLEQQAGDYQRAARYYAQAYRAMRGRADAASVVAVLLNFANTHMEAGNHAVADYYYARVAEWAQARGQHMLAWNAALNAALSAYRQQDFAKAEATLAPLLQQPPAAGPEMEGLARALLARVRAAAGDPFGALDLVGSAERIHAQAPFAPLAQQIELARGRALLAIDAYAQAETALAKALGMDERAQDRTRLEALQLHALALSAQGRLAEAEARLKDASALETRLQRAANAFTFRLEETLQLPDT